MSRAAIETTNAKTIQETHAPPTRNASTLSCASADQATSVATIIALIGSSAAMRILSPVDLAWIAPRSRTPKEKSPQSAPWTSLTRLARRYQSARPGPASSSGTSRTTLGTKKA